MSTPALRTRPIFIALAAVLFLLPHAASAQNTIHVPADQATIQGAINVANNGDTVLVAPGTYNENINFNGKAITVTSSGGSSATIIDGGAKGPVVTFSSAEGLKSVLNGFTIQNGTADGSPSNPVDGGGIYVYFTSPTITNNVIQNNTACADGAGVAVEYGSPLIQGNTIQDNREFGCTGGDGGGIFIGGTGSAQIIGNLIANNIRASGNGGGIMLNSAGTPTIRNNVIVGNTATGTSAAHGGGISMINGSSPFIVQNLLYNNNAAEGSGISFESPSATAVNNTIIAGSSAIVGGSGGSSSAVYTYSIAQIQFFNNLIIGSSGQNAVYCLITANQPPPTFVNNDAFSPNGTGFAGSCAGESGQNGNVSVDPQFVNSAGEDFHLRTTSPAIDAGTNAAPNLPETDLGENPRIVDGNNDCLNTVDLGVYEFVPTPNGNASFSTSSLTFPNQPVRTSSSAQPITLGNSGTTCFRFSSVGVTGDFAQTNNCSGGVRGGSSCVFNVTFTPTAIGTRLGTLAVTGSDGVTTKTPTVSLSGTGVDFSVAATPTAATVKHAKSAQFNVTVGPVGGADSSAVALSCSGLPTAAGCSFSPSNVIPGSNGANSALTLSTSGNTPRGTFNVQIVGTSGSTLHSATVQITIN